MAWFRKSLESMRPELLRDRLPSDIHDLLGEIIDRNVSALTTSLMTTGIVSFGRMKIFADWREIFQEDMSKQSKRPWQRIRTALLYSSVTPANRIELFRIAALTVRYIGAPLFYGWWNRGRRFCSSYPLIWLIGQNHRHTRCCSISTLPKC
ncbi:MAG: hypothetical protein C7B45_17140 [Sulfobacillus acidophilus]|uniref:Uncharacterized protein n=1 Tax=Sulfobacillus acidophilus TaxID=53633 RepID=A0A2T2WCM9_9FIRM|nr:MAG: hypothetical protein C7B45_17140 [Sulfobacillus acidophilus]